MPQIRVVGPDGEEQIHSLTQAAYVLGRDPKTDIPLQDKKVSRQHARIFKQGADYFVEDMGSANGVLVAGNAIRKPVQLTNGMEVEVGSFLVTYAADAEATGGAVFSLVGLTDPVEGQTYALPIADVHVGRGDDSDIVISHGSVSRNHAVLEVDAEKLVVEDLGSSNGTFVNDERVAREPLKHGDRLRFGNIEFDVVAEDSGGAARPAPVAGGALLDKFKKADSSLKLAAVMFVMTVLLLLIVIVIMLAKGGGGGDKIDPFIAYEKAIENGLATARAQLQGESWDAAVRSYQDVLDQDPINPEAREGLYKAQVGQYHLAVLNAARADLGANQSVNAAKRLASIPADSHYADQAAAMLQEAKKQRADEALAQAQDACSNKEWETCHRWAIVALTNQPESAAGQQLVGDAEQQLKKKIPFTPWAP